MKLVPRRTGLFDDRLNDFFNDTWFPAVPKGSALKTDIVEKDGNYTLSMEVPGFNKEDIDIELVNGTLTISATKDENKEEKDTEGNVIRKERYTGSTSRSFYLGEGYTEDDIKAKYENGELQLTFPTQKVKDVENKKTIAIE